MPITLYRIDDRLVHGQVVEAWVPYLHAGEIAVISDDIAHDAMRQTIMRFAAPEGVGLKILPVAEAPAYLLTAEASASNMLVLLPGLAEAVDLIKKGVKITKLNVGGMHYSAGKNLSIGKAIFLNDADCAALRFLSDSNVIIEGRGVPSDSPLDLIAAIAS
ncbi:MAG: PTS sugar transporter subunit IIB [Elusimicrobia bacterium]|nr:PTS sugar transporter subunit IIB [Elusimicrobiota bacterium]